MTISNNINNNSIIFLLFCASLSTQVSSFSYSYSCVDRPLNVQRLRAFQGGVEIVQLPFHGEIPAECNEFEKEQCRLSGYGFTTEYVADIAVFMHGNSTRIAIDIDIYIIRICSCL